MRPQAPAAPTLTHDPKDDELRCAEWYWGKITREEAKNILSGKPDGSFLVRDALSKEGEYTLTLIKDGSEKLIKICHMDGKYGFVEGKFNSVVEMINYYKVNSLKMYNKMLDVTLSNPIVRAYDDEDAQPYGDLRVLVEDFIGAHQHLLNHQQTLDQKLEEFKYIEHELHEKKLHQEVFLRAEKMFQNQLTVIESFIKSIPLQSSTGSGGGGGGTLGRNSGNIGSGNGKNASQTGVNSATRQQEQEQLQENASTLNAHLTKLNEEMKKLNDYVKEKKDGFMSLERQINSLKPEILTLVTRKDKYIERLKDFNLTDEDLKFILEMGFDKWHQQHESVSNQPHKNESLWFLRDSKRQDAEELLKGAPTGTFLIRAREVGHYALSIVCKSSIHHCIIYETESGFGFAAPYNIYLNLKDLVEHYSTNSLEEHNDTLTTTLRIPVLYWHQNMEYITQQLKEELEYTQVLIATTPSSAIPIPVAGGGQGRIVGAGGLDVVDLAGSTAATTDTPPSSISPSNFSTSQ